MFSDSSKINLDNVKAVTNTTLYDVDGADPIHEAAFRDTIKRCLELEAKSYGANFVNAGFKNVRKAVLNSEQHTKAQVLLLEFDQTKSICAGASIQFPTIRTEWDNETGDFAYYNALYIEDFTVDPNISVALKTNKISLPDNLGLGSFFLKKQLENAAHAENDLSHTPATALVVECGEGYIAPEKVLQKFGGEIRSGNDSYVYTFEDKPHKCKNYKTDLKLNVKPCNLWKSPAQDTLKKLNHSFAISINEMAHGYNLAITFTRAISSFTGDSIIRVNMISDGRLEQCNSILRARYPLGQHPELTQFIRPMLLCGASESIARGWVNGKPKTSDAIKSMRIHIEGKEIAAALQELGATQRILGKYKMKSYVSDFINPKSKLLPKFNKNPAQLTPTASNGDTKTDQTRNGCIAAKRSNCKTAPLNEMIL